jgi:hypothetical protein
MLDDLTIIIPVGAKENAWRSLLKDLKTLPPAAEMLVVGAEPKPADFEQFVARELSCATRWLRSTAGRARQLNYGAENSTRSYLWFLHADSHVDDLALGELKRALQDRPSAIHYFVLAFQTDGPRITRLNSWGANLRSRWFGLPFGDQGFCVAKAVFQALGKFDESSQYGEDHLLIWKAHQKGVQVAPIHAKISTSARKYRSNGWIRTTFVHLWRTARQGLPQFLRSLVNKAQ